MKNETEITSANFEEVFKAYFGPLCNYVNSYINNWEGSREIVQGAFMKIWENKEDITITSSIKNYLYSTVRNRMIDGIRTDKKLEEYRNSISVDALVENPKDLDPYLLREEILKAVDNLKPKMKKIFSLSKFEGLTYSEIASFMNISKRAVEDNVARSLFLLREELKDNV